MMQENKIAKNSAKKPAKKSRQKVMKPKEPRPPKPPKRWNTNLRTMAVLRGILIGGVILLVGLGVWNVIKGDRTPQLRAEMKETEQALQTKVVLQSEAKAFAQDFINHYVTYEGQQRDDYRRRLERYCGARLAADITENLSLRESAAADYVQALHLTEYSKNQYDITVMAEVAYTKRAEATRAVDSGNTASPAVTTTKKTLYFIVPLYSDGNGKYIIEDIPRLTAPPEIANYNRQEHSGEHAADIDKNSAQHMLNDFLKTWYAEAQNKIDYYLAEDADKTKFQELLLHGSMDFVMIESLALYKTALSNEYLAIVTIKTNDMNGTEIRQRFNILLQKRDKFYAKDINLRTYNL